MTGDRTRQARETLRSGADRSGRGNGDGLEWSPKQFLARSPALHLAPLSITEREERCQSILFAEGTLKRPADLSRRDTLLLMVQAARHLGWIPDTDSIGSSS